MLSLLSSLVLLATVGTAVEAYCTPTCLADEICNNSSVCAANTTYYQSLGLNVNNVSAAVTCKGANMTISVGKNLLETLRYNPSASTLSQSNCTGAVLDILQGQRVYSLTVQTKDGVCGNTITKNSTHVTFANSILIPGQNSNGIIAAGNISIQFFCAYNITMQTSLYIAYKPVMTTQTLNSGNSGGDGTTTLAAYTSPTYTVPLEQSQQQELPVGSSLYFGMTTQFPDPAFVLRIDQCYATPTSDGSGSIRVQLIQGGCPTGNGPNIQVVENGVSKEVRFSVSSFSFQGYGSVYIFCDARLCNAASGSCSKCASAREVSQDTTQFSLGPFTVQDIDYSAGSQMGLSGSLLVGSLMCLLTHYISDIM
ncbi:uromodulin-like [Leptodactylus fuscus]|uniref:uromodulin-like n=1 Tax=Leptodactylus fuscus TaxID=238119 RepID=UPI003F4F3897